MAYVKMVNSFIFIFLFYFISFAKKKKRTNKQKERWQGHRNSCGQLQRVQILLIIKKAQEILKNTAIQEKLLTATYIPLISRVFGPYCKLRTEFFSVDLWPKREARGP